MKLLAIETATEACSAALFVDGEINLSFQVKPRGHSELILGMMNELLADAGLKLSQLDSLAFGRGPGSFTGVRIATGVVQGTAFGADLPVVPVSTLAALAQRGFREHAMKRLLPAYDARMGEVYWAAYQVNRLGLVELIGHEQVVAAADAVIPEGGDWYGIGSGWAAYGEELAARFDGSLIHYVPDLLCSAYDLALLAVAGFEQGQAVAPEFALPVYLRDRVAKKPSA